MRIPSFPRLLHMTRRTWTRALAVLEGAHGNMRWEYKATCRLLCNRWRARNQLQQEGTLFRGHDHKHTKRAAGGAMGRIDWGPRLTLCRPGAAKAPHAPTPLSVPDPVATCDARAGTHADFRSIVASLRSPRVGLQIHIHSIFDHIRPFAGALCVRWVHGRALISRQWLRAYWAPDSSRCAGGLRCAEGGMHYGEPSL